MPSATSACSGSPRAPLRPRWWSPRSSRPSRPLRRHHRTRRDGQETENFLVIAICAMSNSQPPTWHLSTESAEDGCLHRHQRGSSSARFWPIRCRHPVVLSGIAEGVENSNFLVLRTGGQFILTLYEKRVNRDDLPFFLGLMQHLALKGLSCPLPIERRDGGHLGELAGRPAAMVSFLDGIWLRQAAGPPLRRGRPRRWPRCTWPASGFPLTPRNGLTLELAAAVGRFPRARRRGRARPAPGNRSAAGGARGGWPRTCRRA
jgi:hypothetical protein